MINGTSDKENMLMAGERLKECRELRGITQEKLAELIELLPGNNGKVRSAKQISYLENGTRAISMEYAVLLSQALHVRIEYLLLKDDYKTDIERIGASATTRNKKWDAILSLIRLHGYIIDDATREFPAKVDESGEEYWETKMSISTPKGGIRYFSSEEFMKLLTDIDDYIEMKCAFSCKRIEDGVSNIYTLG